MGPGVAARVAADEVLRVEPVAVVRRRTRALDRLPTRRCGTERVIRFVVVVGAEGFAIEDVECSVWERFLWRNHEH